MVADFLARGRDFRVKYFKRHGSMTRNWPPENISAYISRYRTAKAASSRSSLPCFQFLSLHNTYEESLTLSLCICLIAAPVSVCVSAPSPSPSLYVCLPLCLPVRVCLPLSAHLSPPVSVCLSLLVNVCVCPFLTVYVCLSLSLCLRACLCVLASDCLRLPVSICLPVSVSDVFCLCAPVSFCLSLPMCLCLCASVSLLSVSTITCADNNNTYVATQTTCFPTNIEIRQTNQMCYNAQPWPPRGRDH